VVARLLAGLLSAGGHTSVLAQHSIPAEIVVSTGTAAGTQHELGSGKRLAASKSGARAQRPFERFIPASFRWLTASISFLRPEIYGLLFTHSMMQLHHSRT